MSCLRMNYSSDLHAVRRIGCGCSLMGVVTYYDEDRWSLREESRGGGDLQGTDDVHNDIHDALPN